jgi:hypothetical protein
LRRERTEQLAGQFVVAQHGKRLPPGMKPAALAERDQPLDDRAKFLGLRQGGLDLLMADQGSCHVGESRLAMAGGSAELAAGDGMAHVTLLRDDLRETRGLSTAPRASWRVPRCSRAASS